MRIAKRCGARDSDQPVEANRRAPECYACRTSEVPKAATGHRKASEASVAGEEEAEPEGEEPMKTVTTYLSFNGNCGRAMSFYRQCLETELEVNPYPDANGQPSSDLAARIMHSQLV